LLTLRGTPTIYQGEEIGMKDVPIPADQIQDPWERNVPGLGLGRDPERTPMQWDASPNAGFSSARPWLPVSPDYTEVNVAVQSCSSRSMLSLYRALLGLRRFTPALKIGAYRQVHLTQSLLVFDRLHDRTCLRIALNFSGQPHSLELPPGEVLLSSHLDVAGGSPIPTILRPHEGIILRQRPYGETQ
jgi:alpha-glucosidase